jgi:hypothetical protein
MSSVQFCRFFPATNAGVLRPVDMPDASSEIHAEQWSQQLRVSGD